MPITPKATCIVRIALSLLLALYVQTAVSAKKTTTDIEFIESKPSSNATTYTTRDVAPNASMHRDLGISRRNENPNYPNDEWRWKRDNTYPLTTNMAAPIGTITTPEPTVRVNNLANLEALLNIIANGCEIGGIAGGVQIFLLAGVLRRLPDRQHLSGWFIGLGVFSMVFGLAFPGVVNWLVASARDANLFS